MPIGIVIAVAVVLIVVAAVISHFLTVSNLKKMQNPRLVMQRQGQEKSLMMQ